MTASATNKYNINADVTSSSITTTKEKTEETFCDLLFNFMESDGTILDKTEIENVRKFIIDQEFESDTIKDDFDVNFDDQQPQSNFHQEFNGKDSFGSIREFMNKYKS